MALQFTQLPGALMPAQSPIIFSVRDDTFAYTSSAFQYTADIYSWTGNPNQSGSTPTYTLRKYPNASGSGIFDISRFIIGTIPSSISTITNIDNAFTYYKVIFNFTYKSGSANITGSNLSAITTGSVNYSSYDGYYTNPFNDFNVSLNQQSPSSSYPFLTDSTTVTQSVLTTDEGWNQVYCGQLAPASQLFQFTGSYVNGSTATATLTLTQTTNSLSVSKDLAVFPSTSGFPLSTTNLTKYTVKTGSLSLNFVVDCPTKYPSKRIVFKNKYGAKEYINMNLVSTTTVNGNSKSFRPQLGDWNATSFNYDNSQVQNQKYISDAVEVLTLNSEYLPEAYNNIIEQLIVSDEIYLYDPAYVIGQGQYVPLEIITSNVQFKTGVVDKLIQYTLQFRKNNYKLIL
jgi:hypothetical protein